MKICILGNDKRSLKLRELYKDEAVLSSILDSEIVIAPIPFSRDDANINSSTTTCGEVINSIKGTNKILITGSISNNMKKVFEENSLKYYDLFDYEEVAILNAIPTAEGAIQVAMEMTDKTIHDSHVLILGYGRISKILAKMLVGLGANVTCSARKQKDLATIYSFGYSGVETKNIDKILCRFDIIMNTIPSIVLDEKRLKLINKECKIIDLASPPGGLDYVVAKELGLDARWELSIPSKVASLSAAKYLKESIDRILKDELN